MDDSDLEYQPPTEVAFGAGTSRGQAASAGEGAAPAAAPAPAATDAGRVDAAAVGRPVFTKVVTGDAFSCGLLRNGSAACFGEPSGVACSVGRLQPLLLRHGAGAGDSRPPTPLLFTPRHPPCKQASCQERRCGPAPSREARPSLQRWLAGQAWR